MTRMASIALGAAVMLAMALSSMPAYAQCQDELAEIGRRLDSGDLNPTQRQMLQSMRQSAAFLCNSGQADKVSELVERLDQMLNAPGIGSPMPTMPGMPQRPTSQPKSDDEPLAPLTVEYLEGDWCVVAGEAAHYRFDGDGTYASAPPGHQLAGGGDIANFHAFYDELKSKEADRFVVLGHGREEVFVRGNCDQARSGSDRSAGSATAAAGEGGSGPGYWIDRPDEMFQYWYQDTDSLDGRLRVLYWTSPSLEQGQAGPWTANVYVAEVMADGSVSQHRLYSKQSLETVTMALRPGHEQVFVQRTVEGGENPDRLDVWSVPAGDVLSTVDIPTPSDAGLARSNWSQFRTTTLDGNVVFTTTTSQGRRSENPVSIAAWMEVAPDGSVIGSGEQRLNNARQRITHWFPAHSGGAGMALDITKLDEQGLSDLIDSPIVREVGGRQLRGVVRSETRLAVTDADSTDLALGPALERELMWTGEMAVPQDLPADERMDQNNRQMRLMAETEVEAGARRHVRILKPTADGYGVLMRVVGDRRIEPDVNGRHFVEVTLDGPRRTIFLKPIADDLDVQFENFAGGADGAVYLFGDGRGRSDDFDGVIMRLEADGSPGPTVPVSIPDGVSIDEVFAGPAGLWLIGHGRHPQSRLVSLWVQQIQLAEFE